MWSTQGFLYAHHIKTQTVIHDDLPRNFVPMVIRKLGFLPALSGAAFLISVFKIKYSTLL